MDNGVITTNRMLNSTLTVTSEVVPAGETRRNAFTSGRTVNATLFNVPFSNTLFISVRPRNRFATGTEYVIPMSIQYLSNTTNNISGITFNSARLTSPIAVTGDNTRIRFGDQFNGVNTFPNPNIMNIRNDFARTNTNIVPNRYGVRSGSTATLGMDQDTISNYTWFEIDGPTFTGDVITIPISGTQTNTVDPVSTFTIQPGSGTPFTVSAELSDTAADVLDIIVDAINAQTGVNYSAGGSVASGLVITYTSHPNDNGNWSITTNHDSSLTDPVQFGTASATQGDNTIYPQYRVATPLSPEFRFTTQAEGGGWLNLPTNGIFDSRLITT